MNLTKQQWKLGYTPEDIKNHRENKLAMIGALIIGLPLMILFTLTILTL